MNLRRVSTRFVNPAIVAAMQLSLLACGDVSDAAEDAAGAVREGSASLGSMTKQAALDVQEFFSDGYDDLNAAIDAPVVKQRRKKCEQENGTFAGTVEVSPCRDGKCTVTVDGDRQEQTCGGDTVGDTVTDQCVHTTWNGTYYFNDGPSVPHLLQRAGEIADSTNFILYNSIFWDAAVNHDYCYHHGQATYGYDQAACDSQFVDDLMALCLGETPPDADWFDQDSCINNAHGMYGAVRAAGSSSFNMMNTQVHYPKYEPMYKKIGLKEQPVDDDLRQIIDGTL